MSRPKIFIGDVFSLPLFINISSRFSTLYEEALREHRAHLKKVLEVQIQAFKVKFNKPNVVPRSCYVSNESESEDVAIMMPETKEGIVTYWDQLPLELKPGQAVFTSGW